MTTSKTLISNENGVTWYEINGTDGMDAFATVHKAFNVIVQIGISFCISNVTSKRRFVVSPNA